MRSENKWSVIFFLFGIQNVTVENGSDCSIGTFLLTVLMLGWSNQSVV